jgi:hypothetical protein
MVRTSQAKRAAEDSVSNGKKRKTDENRESDRGASSSSAPLTAGAIVAGFSDGESEAGPVLAPPKNLPNGGRVAGSSGFILAAHEELVCPPCGASSKDRLQLFIIS